MRKALGAHGFLREGVAFEEVFDVGDVETRFGGLRCPSEVLALNWEDTAWMGNSQIVASKHYLQLRDEHFDRAANESGECPKGVQQTHEGQKVESQGQSKGQKASELTETVKPVKAKNPEKLKVLRGSADGFVPLREQLMGAEGLEPPTPSV